MHLTPLANPVPSNIAQIGQAAAQAPAEQAALQEAQQKVISDKLANSSTRIILLTQMASANPALASDPSFVQNVEQAFDLAGLKAPIITQNQTVQGMMKATPTVDITALGAHTPFQTFLSDPTNRSSFLSWDQATKTAMAKQNGWNVDPSLLALAPQVPMSASAQNQLIEGLRTLPYQVAGGMPIKDALAWAKATAQALDKVLGAGSTDAFIDYLSTSLNPVVAANIKQKAAAAGLDSAKTNQIINEEQAVISKIQSQADLDEANAALTNIEAKWFGPSAQAKIGLEGAQSTEAFANADRAEAAAKLDINKAAVVLASGSITGADSTRLLTSITTNQKNLTDSVAKLRSDALKWKQTAATLPAGSNAAKQALANAGANEAKLQALEPTVILNTRLLQGLQKQAAARQGLNLDGSPLGGPASVPSQTRAWVATHHGSPGQKVKVDGHVYTYDAATGQWMP